MSERFDPYRKWFGIPPKDQPPNHYRLLGIALFESDSEVIGTAADQRMEYLKQCAGGENGDAAEEVLTLVAAARLCLLDAEKKAAYDAQLRRSRGAGTAGPPPLAVAKPRAQAQRRAESVDDHLSAMRDISTQPSAGNSGVRRRTKPAAAKSAAAARKPSRDESHYTKLVAVASCGLAAAIALYTFYVKKIRAVPVQNPAPQVAMVDPPADPRANATRPANANATPKSAAAPSHTAVSKSAAPVGAPPVETIPPKPADNPGPPATKPKDAPPEAASSPSVPPTQDIKPSSTSAAASALVEKSIVPPAKVEPAAVSPAQDSPQPPPSSDKTTGASQKRAADKHPPEKSEPKLEPVPSQDVIQAARKLVHEVFAADLEKAKRPAERTAVAEKMLDEAAKSNQAVDQYALLGEASRIGVEAGDATVVIRAVEATDKRFKIDPYQVATEQLERIAREGVPSEIRIKSAEAILDFAETAVNKDRYDAAKRALVVALAQARGAGDLPLVKRIVQRDKEVVELKSRQEAYSAASETLANSPNDPDANMTVGKYWCYDKKNWGRGLPYLARSGDPTLSELARRELAKPGDAGEQAALGDAWWNASEKAQAADKSRMIARAKIWYERALPDLKDLKKIAVTKRLDQIADVEAPPAEKGSDRTPAEKSSVARPGTKTLASQIKDAVQNNTVVQSSVAGPGGGTPFNDLPAEGCLLIGFNASFSSSGYVSSMQPIYSGAKGPVLGSVYGYVYPPISTFTAKNGYAVSAIQTHADTATIYQFQLGFMKVGRNGLEKTGAYTSPVIGAAWISASNPGLPYNIGGDGRPIVGVFGSSGRRIYGLGVYQVPEK